MYSSALWLIRVPRLTGSPLSALSLGPPVSPGGPGNPCRSGDSVQHLDIQV